MPYQQSRNLSTPNQSLQIAFSKAQPSFATAAASVPRKRRAYRNVILMSACSRSSCMSIDGSPVGSLSKSYLNRANRGMGASKAS